MSEFNRLKNAQNLNLNRIIEVHAGHGFDYKTTNILTKIKEIEEFNIGHFIIGRVDIFGLSKVIKILKRF